jgi:hypothetical protein
MIQGREASQSDTFGRTGDGGYKINIVTYFDDFRKAVDGYLAGLSSDPSLQENLRKALKGRPRLA